MRVPLIDVGRQGRLDLAFGVREGQTVLLDSYCEVPFKITRTLSTAETGIAHLMLMHCTAGLFGGDRLRMSVHVGRGARVRLTQQSATRVHPSEERVAFQSNRIVVEQGAAVEVFFEPVIPFAKSRLNQETAIEVEEGAQLCYWEALMAGRIGRGELWAFDELSSETRLTRGGRLVYLDRFSLRPERETPAGVWGMGRGSYLGTGLRIGDDAGGLVERLRDALPGAGLDVLAEDVISARIVERDGPAFHRCRDSFGRMCRNGVFSGGFR